MQKSLKPVLLALFMLVPLAARAGDTGQEQNQTRTQAQSQVQAQAQQDKNKAGEKTAQQQGKEKAKNGHPVVKDFKPSEGISEDLSVSFPTDI